MEQITAEAVFVGIDVAKAHVDVHIHPTNEAFRVPRDATGLDHLVNHLRQFPPNLVVLEATGGFEQVVTATLAGAGLPVAIINPRQIRDFARATGQLAKHGAADQARGAWPRMIVWMPKLSRASRRRSARKCGRCRTRLRRASPNWRRADVNWSR